MIDTFLEAARRTQNALVPYISRGLSIGLKSSLGDVMKDVAQGKVVLHPVLDDLLRGYWGSYGSRLKDYRDLSQHHALVSSDARIYTDENGKPGLYLLLPSNPEAKNPAKLEFGNPSVFAFMYIREQFHKLLSTTYWVTRALFDLIPGESKQFVGHIFRDPVVLGPGVQRVAHRLFAEEELDKEISDRVARCDEKYREYIAQVVRGEKEISSTPNPAPAPDC
ncbi:MAG TPA: hypothetical protein VNJ70_10285 [Thermoanaerobaculia bacterium]|nr:hypothetical protein [Thermoanaerobaculia bacterium]